jgi:hypothetical protein
MQPIRPFPLRNTIASLPGPTQLVPQQGAGVQAGLDIRTDFNDFLATYGQMVLVQRLSQDIHCWHCWIEIEESGDPQCPYCLGRGRLSIYERHLSRRASSLNEHRQQLETISSEGPQVVDEVFWYFEHNVNPYVQDMVYEVTWKDAALTEVERILTAYEMTYCVPNRAASGRVEYWRSSGRARPIDRTILSAHLSLIAAESLQIPEDGILRYVASYP